MLPLSSEHSPLLSSWSPRLFLLFIAGWEGDRPILPISRAAAYYRD